MTPTELELEDDDEELSELEERELSELDDAELAEEGALA
jgi:hypothetical protein